MTWRLTGHKSSLANRNVDKMLLGLLSLPLQPSSGVLYGTNEAFGRKLLMRASAHGAVVMAARRLREDTNLSQELRLKTSHIEGLAMHRDMCLARSAVRVIRTLEASGIRAFVHKGPALWRALGLQAPSRISSDIDVIISPDDITSANIALGNLGYRCHESKGQEATYMSNDQPSVDLHWGLLTVGGWGNRLDGFFQDAWDRRATININGTFVPTLSPTDTTVALALHWGCHHICTDWTQLHEIAQCTIRWKENIDWDCIVRLAENARIENALCCPFLFSKCYFGALIPDWVSKRLRLPIHRKGLHIIAVAAFRGYIHSYPARRIARTFWNLLLQPGPCGLIEWGIQWAKHQGSKRELVTEMNALVDRIIEK